jgi:hypothetical protein
MDENTRTKTLHNLYDALQSLIREIEDALPTTEPKGRLIAKLAQAD